MCFCNNSGSLIPAVTNFRVCHDKEGAVKTTLALMTAAVLTLLSIAGCAQYDGYYGKGKAPPPPVITKG